MGRRRRVFPRLSASGDKAAENLTESLTVGAKVIVTGRLRQRSYETEQRREAHRLRSQMRPVGPSSAQRHGEGEPGRAIPVNGPHHGTTWLGEVGTQMSNHRSSKATGIDTTTRLNVMKRADNALRTLRAIHRQSARRDPSQAYARDGMDHAVPTTPTNCVVVCDRCHQWIGANPNDADEVAGMSGNGTTPETVPLTNIYGHTFLLDGDRRVDPRSVGMATFPP